tara:strand:- start:1503 stop:1979 length:477 start_codon:yes stop_codon:yes gene_type:complete
LAQSDFDKHSASLMVVAGIAAVVVLSPNEQVLGRYNTGEHLHSYGGNAAVTVYENVEDKLPWLKEFYKDAGEAEDARSVFPLVVGLKKLLAEGSYQTIDRILMELPLNRVSSTSLVAFLSSVFPARKKLQSWSYTLERVKMTLDSKGLDSMAVLRGML